MPTQTEETKILQSSHSSPIIDKSMIAIEQQSLQPITINIMFPTRRAVNYLCKKEEYSHYECSVCFNLSLDTCRCEGPCQKYYCKPCIDRIASRYEACRFCSYRNQSIQWKYAPLPSLKFVCPYTLKAHTDISSVQQFQQHCFSCPQISEQYKSIAHRIENYQCNEGHSLVFISATFAKSLFQTQRVFYPMTNSECDICKQITTCRSYCAQCSQTNGKIVLYCIKCKEIPVKEGVCPLGHQIRQKHNRSSTQICDFCGCSHRLSRQLSYADEICDILMCFLCFQKHKNKYRLQLTNQQRE